MAMRALEVRIDGTEGPLDWRGNPTWPSQQVRIEAQNPLVQLRAVSDSQAYAMALRIIYNAWVEMLESVIARQEGWTVGAFKPVKEAIEKKWLYTFNEHVVAIIEPEPMRSALALGDVRNEVFMRRVREMCARACVLVLPPPADCAVPENAATRTIVTRVVTETPPQKPQRRKWF